MARRRGDGPSPKSCQSNCRLSDITIVVAQLRAIDVSADAHCQVNGCGDACRQAEDDSDALRCLVDAGLLSPDPECLRASASIAGSSSQEMSAWPEGNTRL